MERPLVPDPPLIKEERFALRVPVTGHKELAGSIEIIFDQLRFGLRLVVLVKRMVIFQRLSTVVQRSNIIRINYRLPLAIQASGLTRIDIRDQRRNLCCTSRGEERQTQTNCQTAEQITHERAHSA